MHSEKGIILGAYSYSQGAVDMSALPLAELHERTHGHRRAASGPWQGSGAPDRHRLGQSPLHPGHRRALEGRAGRALYAAERTWWPVLFRRRAFEPCWRVAGRRYPVRAPRRARDRQSPPRHAPV